MYSRAARNVVQIVGSTPKQVGPGAYDLNGSSELKKQQTLDSYAPFMSLSLREGVFAASNLNETPGKEPHTF
jgi:hypothetical protein